MRGVTAANHGKRFDSGSLLADLVPGTKPREAAAQFRKRRNRRGKPPARSLTGEIAGTRKSRLRNCGDQTRVIHHLSRHRSLARASRRAILGPDANVGEKIELSLRHPGMMPRVVRVSIRQ